MAMIAIITVIDPAAAGLGHSTLVDRVMADAGVMVFNDVCRELAEFCCSVDECREVDRRINRTFESTHSANLHATRPVVSGKTEAEISVAVTWISWT